MLSHSMIVRDPTFALFMDDVASRAGFNSSTYCVGLLAWHGKWVGEQYSISCTSERRPVTRRRWVCESSVCRSRSRAGLQQYPRYDTGER